jgi:ABC-2 type transport system permease protein
MKTTFKIARTELRILFYSPIAWFLLIVFLIQCGIVYFGRLGNIAVQQEMSGAFKPNIADLTGRIFLSKEGLFSSVMQNVYLYIPLLTMSLISREMSSGTIKLLYSSPIRIRQIIFGKFFAMMLYNLLLVAIIGIFVSSGMYQVQNAEAHMLMTALLSFYLLLCAYAAIGLFMSCLTTYQVVAAICTFIMIGILSKIGDLWQNIAFVRELTYFLSINGRAQKLMQGLVTTKDIIYFVVIIYIFLGLSIYKLKSGMESRPFVIKAGYYAGIVVTGLLLGYITSIPQLTGYYDATNNQSMTLTPEVQKILKDLGDDPLEITAYNNLLGKFWYLGSPESYNQNRAAWEPYIRFKDHIKLRTVLYYDSVKDDPYMALAYPGKSLKQIAQQISKNLKVNINDIKTPEEIHQIIDLRPEQNRYVMQLKWRNKTTFLRVYEGSNPWPGETEVAAALKRLQAAALPRIVFLTGDLERDINNMGDGGYKTLTNLSIFRNSLVNQGFDVDTVSLETHDVPANIAALVISDPKLELRPATLGKLRQYILKGGNLLIAGEPGRQALLNPLLKELNVQLTDGRLLQENKGLAPDMVTPAMTQQAAAFTKTLAKKAADGEAVYMPGAAALSSVNNGNYKVQPLLITDAHLSWNRIQPIDLTMVTQAVASEKGQPVLKQDANMTARSANGKVYFDKSGGDVKEAAVTALSLTRNINGKEQRILVTGDADFMSNSGLSISRSANFYFSTALFSWLSYGKFPIDATRPDSQDKPQIRSIILR